MPDTDSHGSCVFYSETWEGVHQVGEKKRLCPFHRVGSSSVPLLFHPKPNSSAGISSEVHHRPVAKSCLGKRADYPAKAGRSQPQRWVSAEGRVPGAQPSSCPTCLLPAPWRLGKNCDLDIEMKAQT